MEIPETCVETVAHSIITLKDGKSQSASILNDSRRPHKKTRFDGCVVSGELAADWLLEDPSLGMLIVELKGLDLEHGAKQVAATAAWLKAKGTLPTRFAGVVVGRQYPRIDTTLQRAVADFAKSFRAPLHILSRDPQKSVAALLEFS